jgi:tRNA A-37 threonylcarbamoyl transferase component Bud32
VTECTHCRKRYENGVRFCPVDGFAVVPVAEPMLGRTLMGQFQIQSVCGHGATGTVYRATQVGIDREVAVKLLRADLLKDPDVIKRFIREARAGARLNHPNIATVHMVGQSDEGVPFLVMEFIEGVALSAVLGVGKPLPLRRMVHIGAQIASALSEAHGQSIVHRDLKPENILLTDRRGESDVVKVVDFGIAKMIAHAAPGEDPISRMGTVFGTPHYIAPEQAAGQPVDGRADIYSLGCILFQMATGRVPFDGHQGLQVLLRQVRDPVPDPRTLNPRISPALSELILKMLAKDPAGRPQSAALAAEALRELTTDEAVAPPVSGRRAEPPRSGSAVRAESPRSGSAVRAESPRSGSAARADAVNAARESDRENAREAARETARETAGETARETARETDWYQRDESAEEGDEAEAESADLVPPPRRRRRSSDAVPPSVEREPRGRARRPSRSGRPSPSYRDDDSDEIMARRAPEESFWQRHWMPVVSIGSAIALGATAGILYAHYHAVQQVPPPPPPPVIAAPLPAAPPQNLIRSSTPARTQGSQRSASTSSKPAESNVPVMVFPAAPPLTGPRPLGPLLAPPPMPGTAPLLTNPAPSAPVATAAPTVSAPPPAPSPSVVAAASIVLPTASAPAPVPAPAAAPSPPPPPAAAPAASAPPPAAPAAPPVVAVSTPPAAPSPPPSSPPAEKSAASEKSAAPAAPPPKSEEPPPPPAAPPAAAPAKSGDEPEESGNDPYHRLK